ncbi:MAG TPA: protein kinase [bacterium]|nr:protein kinase [bacterium]
MIGTTLRERYRVDAKLGEGGMGVVYRAHDTLLNRPVALKSLTPALVGEDGVRRLMREAQSAAQLNHPNVVAVYDVVDDGQARLIVMEYVDGRPLAELVPLDVPLAIDLALQICRALEYAHGRGIIHRDIKPENILVADRVAKVTDFGLARSEGRSRLTQSGLIVGTVAYMAPEQVLGGNVDGRTDLYALGCVLYEVLTGRKPFEGDDPFTILSQQVNVMPVAPRWHSSAIPPTVDAIIMRLLAKDPAERYASAAQVGEALELAAGAETAQTVDREAPTSRTTLLERIVRGKLVGRAAEVRELHEHLDRVLSGEGRLVLLSGEPGIGKTRLAEELSVYAHLRGAWVLRGHCYEQEVGVPHLPFIETLRQLYQHTGDSLLIELGERADDLAPLLPDLKRKSPDASGLMPDDERMRLFDAVTSWVSEASRRRPLLFVLDDLHWADRASLRLLHHLARSSRGARVLMLGTYREVELDLEHPLNDALSQMNRERLFYRLPLRRLSEEDTRALLSGLFDAEVTQELAGAVYRETEGNPFFIEEVVKALVEEGKIYREGGRWQRLTVEELEIPQSVKAVIGRRVQKAGEDSRRVLTIAAVIGREFDPDVLVRVSQLEEDTVLDSLDEAVRLQLIRETRVGRTAGYAFEHALIRQTLYESLNARRRVRLHEQVGEALEAIYGARRDEHVEELAYHFGEVGLATASKGIVYNLQAANKAANLFATEAAERRLMVALELAEGADEPAAQAKVLQALGDLYSLNLDRRRAVGAYQRALEILKEAMPEGSDEVLVLYCRIAEASAGFGTDMPPEATALIQIAVDTLEHGPDTPLKVRARSLLALHRARRGDLGAARAHAEQAITLAARLGDRDELAMAYQALATVHRSSNEWDQFREVVEKRFALRGGALAPSDAELYHDLMMAYTTSGNLAGAEQIGRGFLEVAEKLRSPAAIGRACYWLAEILFDANRWEEAQRYADRAVPFEIGSAQVVGGSALQETGLMAAAHGEDDVARERIAALEGASTPVPPEHMGPRQQALIIALWLEDRETLARLLNSLESEKPHCRTCSWLFYTGITRARLMLGDVDGARAAFDLAGPYLAEKVTPFQRRTGALLRALLAEAGGNLEEAVRHAEEASSLSSGLPRPDGVILEEMPGRAFGLGRHVNTALINEQAGRLYLARGRPGDAERGRKLIVEALDIYRELGARRFEARARKLLDAPGSGS